MPLVPAEALPLSQSREACARPSRSARQSARRLRGSFQRQEASPAAVFSRQHLLEALVQPLLSARGRYRRVATSAARQRRWSWRFFPAATARGADGAPPRPSRGKDGRARRSSWSFAPRRGARARRRRRGGRGDSVAARRRRAVCARRGATWVQSGLAKTMEASPILENDHKNPKHTQTTTRRRRQCRVRFLSFFELFRHGDDGTLLPPPPPRTCRSPSDRAAAVPV